MNEGEASGDTNFEEVSQQAATLDYVGGFLSFRNTEWKLLNVVEIKGNLVLWEKKLF